MAEAAGTQIAISGVAKQVAAHTAEQIAAQLQAQGYLVTVEPPAGAKAAKKTKTTQGAAKKTGSKKAPAKPPTTSPSTQAAVAGDTTAGGADAESSSAPVTAAHGGTPVAPDPLPPGNGTGGALAVGGSTASAAPAPAAAAEGPSPADSVPADPAATVPPPPPAAAVPGADLPVTPLAADLIARAHSAGAVGTGLLLGGQDVEDQAATLVVYRSPAGKGPDRPVLYLKVRRDAEDKVLAAKATAQGLEFMTVVKEVAEHGRPPFDTEGDVAGKVAALAKSVNHHVGEGSPIPTHTLTGLSDLIKTLEQVKDDSQLGESERAAAAAYLADAEEIRQSADAGTKTPKHYGPRECDYVRRVEEKVPLPPKEGQDPLQVTERPGTRPAVHEQDGVPTWGGERKGDAGTEWLFDFGDGWRAVYHPSDPAAGVPFSHRGTLELHPPADADPGAVTAHLERLNLQGRPVSREEAELTYLERNAWAQGLTESAAYQQIHAASAARVAQVASTIAFQTTEPLAPQEVILRAERAVGRQRAAALRGLLEKRMHLSQGALAGDPRYQPAPVWDPARDQGGGAAGHWRWTRMDVDPEQLNAQAADTKVYIYHGVTGQETIERLKHILRTGVLAAQEKRLQMGTAMHGISPDADRQTGGAAYWFARVRKGPKPHEVCFVWDPGTLLRRADWFFRKSDHFGATNPEDHRTTKWITDPERVLQNPGGGNEITFKDGVGMFGPFAPREIRVPQDKWDEILAWCKENGIGEIGGRAVGEVVVGF